MIYDVTVERDGKFWLIRIPELDGVTQARTREEIPDMARDYIAITLGVRPDSFEISVETADEDRPEANFGKREADGD